MYSILKKLLNYLRVAKFLRYDKITNTIFGKVKQLVQRLQSVVIDQRTIWECITIVIALDSLYDYFGIITTSLRHSGDKDLKEIQQIVISTKEADLAKRAIGAIADLALIDKKR